MTLNTFSLVLELGKCIPYQSVRDKQTLTNTKSSFHHIKILLIHIRYYIMSVIIVLRKFRQGILSQKN